VLFFPVQIVVLDGTFAVRCVPGTDYPYILIFQYMLERTDAITNEFLEPITFVLAHPNVYRIPFAYLVTEY